MHSNIFTILYYFFFIISLFGFLTYTDGVEVPVSRRGDVMDILWSEMAANKKRVKQTMLSEIKKLHNICRILNGLYSLFDLFFR